MLVTSAVNGVGNFQFGLIDLPLYDWVTVKIMQLQLADKSYQYSIWVQDKIIHQVINKDPRAFKNVKAYTGSKFYDAAKASIDKLKIMPISK